MDPFVRLVGRAAPLLLPNIDTDVITPMRRIVDLGQRSLGEIAFEPLRYREDGSENPDFVLNDPVYRDAVILLAGANFGCGSSRETAVWAIAQLGYRCIIAPSFGDIFANNCFANGLLPVVLPLRVIEKLAGQTRSAVPFEVDLAACEIATPSGERIAFEVNSLRRDGLLRGLDAIELTLALEAEIAAFQSADKGRRPWIYPSA